MSIPYSVLLAYPLETPNGDIPTYYAHVTAANTINAILTAQAMAVAANPSGGYTAADFRPLLILEGHIEADTCAWDV